MLWRHSVQLLCPIMALCYTVGAVPHRVFAVSAPLIAAKRKRGITRSVILRSWALTPGEADNKTFRSLVSRAKSTAARLKGEGKSLVSNLLPFSFAELLLDLQVDRMMQKRRKRNEALRVSVPGMLVAKNGAVRRGEKRRSLQPSKQQALNPGERPALVRPTRKLLL
jgi:hypothetical protein